MAGDEPTAVHVGARILHEGGSAADAATAMFFTLAVTYPVAAGLGAGGICVAHDPASNTNEAIEFLPRDTAGGGAFAMPGAVRGMATLQGAYGRLPWQRVIVSAEGDAATGFPISAALGFRINSALATIRLDPALSAEFLDAATNPKKIGTVVSNPDLATTLSAIRTQGAGGFYRGSVAEKIADYAVSQKGGPSLAELNVYSDAREAASSFKAGNLIVYGAPQHTGTMAYTSAMISKLVGPDGQLLAPGNFVAAIAQATKQSLDQFKIASLPQDLGATGFAAVDSNGEAVACGVTMNGRFGSAHTVPGTGVTFAAAPSSGQAGLSAAFLSPMIATDGGGALALTAVGAGGPNGTASMFYALLRKGLQTDGPVARSTGMAPYNTIDVIACTDDVCVPASDPSGPGLGLAVSLSN
ncbi:MAG TPA: gamma-glutamyltransferase [Rhizomicrobium sp.]